MLLEVCGRPRRAGSGSAPSAADGVWGGNLQKRDELMLEQRAQDNLLPPRWHIWAAQYFPVWKWIFIWKYGWGKDSSWRLHDGFAGIGLSSEPLEFSLSTGSFTVPPPAGYELLIRCKTIDHNTMNRMNCTRVETRQVPLAYIC